MDEQRTDVEPDLETIYKWFEEWYRKPTWVHVEGEFQVVNREKLLAVIRTFRKLRSNS